MAEFDLVIKNGMVVDGTRAPRFRSDIGIKNGRMTLPRLGVNIKVPISSDLQS